MKKFEWRLQRVLELKQKQEEMQKAELMLITQKLAQARFELLNRTSKRDCMISDVSQLPPVQRLERQRSLYSDLRFFDEQIETCKKNIAELDANRKTKMQQVLALRKARKGLEKLKDRAKVTYNLELRKFEQNGLDESTGIAVARKMLY